jgi:hypothetical protein
VKSVQFGEPEEAGKQFEALIDQAAERKARQIVMSDRLQEEVNRSQAVLDDFRATNKDFFASKMVEAAAEARVYELMEEDLRSLGVSEDDMPKDVNGVAGLHLRFRAGRQRVRGIGDIFAKAKGDVEAVFGTPRAKDDDDAPAEPPAARPATQQGAPKVTVDRRDRRVLIPQNPARATPPQPTPATDGPAPQRRDPSDVIASIAAGRQRVAHNARK